MKVGSRGITFYDGSPMEKELCFFTVAQLSKLVATFVHVRSTEKRTRSVLLTYIASHQSDIQDKIRAAAILESAKGKKRKNPEDTSADGARQKRRRLDTVGIIDRLNDILTSINPRSVTMLGTIAPICYKLLDSDNSDSQAHSTVHELINSPFFTDASAERRKQCIQQYITKTSNVALSQGVCVVCARLMFLSSMKKKTH